MGCSYVSTLTLSLFLFNLLPLPYLDGSQLLEAVFDYVQEWRGGGGDGEDLEMGSGYNSSADRLGALRSRSWKIQRWRGRVVGGAKVVSSGLLGVCVLMGVWNAIF